MKENVIICGDWIEVLKGLPNKVFHCCVTSPPYWGQRDYGCEGQLGLEKTPEEHIDKLVKGFREARRVLRPDGVLWLNYGDKYATTGGDYSNRNDNQPGVGAKRVFDGQGGTDRRCREKPVGNLLMLPARVALALQADGWILRDDVIWAKAISFNDKYSGSTMPESVNGTRWERHRIKVEKQSDKIQGNLTEGKWAHQRMNNAERDGLTAQYQDCPGCPKCEPNDGLVLRKGSWRCTKAHEHLFQLVKSNDYFCDMEAVKEGNLTEPHKAGWASSVSERNDRQPDNEANQREWAQGGGRNLRNVWTINPRGYKDAHYATYPEKLVEPCIKVSTSKKGVCPKCGAQWARVVDSKIIPTRGNSTIGPGYKTLRNQEHSPGNKETTTLGWKATCDCGIEETEPAIVLDPFMGSGTSAVVAAKLGRNYFGCEINPEYKDNHIDERVKEAETGVPIEEARAGQGALFGR